MINKYYFDIPEELDDPSRSDDLLIFKNSTEEEHKKSMEEILDILES